MTLDDCQMECDGMTWAVSHLLNEAGVPHLTACMALCKRTDQGHRDTAFLLSSMMVAGGSESYACGRRSRQHSHGVFHPDNEPDFSTRETRFKTKG